MTHELSISGCANHARLVLAPHFRFTRGNTAEMHHVAANFVRQHGLRRLLVEADKPECGMNTFEAYETGIMIVGSLRLVKTAYCLRDYQPENLRDLNGNPVGKLEFLQDVIINRGGNVGFFNTTEDAETWLHDRVTRPLLN